MKAITTFSVFFLFLFTHSVFAQSNASNDWEEFKNLQEVMERVYQPAVEGNLLPIKTWSETLMQKADQLSLQPIPAKFNSTVLTALITKLQGETKMIYELVTKKQPDSNIMKSLVKANDILNEIVNNSAKAK